MKTDRRILGAFLLNLLFAAIEVVGGILTGSIAILSDAVHDLGDSISIGSSYVLERISRRAPDTRHTYGYTRYSVLGSVITTAILLSGSVVVVWQATQRFFHPQEVDGNGMIVLAVMGFGINLIATLFTRGHGSLNQRAVNLHMMEDVLGWLVVLIGAVVIRLTGWYFIDPLLSIGVAVFIFFSALGTLRRVLDIFLEKTPAEVCTNQLVEGLHQIPGVVEIHHLHVRSIDGYHNAATLHAVVGEGADPITVKGKIKEYLLKMNIVHVTVETEGEGEECPDRSCLLPEPPTGHHHGHHHHGHHHH